MKSITGIKRAAAAGLAACVVLLAGCSGGPGGSEASTSGASPSQEESLHFVAADKTNWDKEITIGEYTYTLAVDFGENGSLELAATCTGRAQTSTGQQGGPGGPGGQETETVETQAPLTDAEKAARNFTRSGSWSQEPGYGYTVTIDGYTTKTNYDKASARHIFYVEITVDGISSGLVQFQGKDTGFRSEIASDYQDFEIRDAEYVFEAVDTSTNNNPNSTKLYLEKDGSANSLTYRGSSPTYTRGTWKENADKSLTVSIGGAEYTADFCDISGKEGYRITYNSSTMYASVSGAEVAYTNEDFNGKTISTLYCAEGDYTVELTEKGFAVIYKNGAQDSIGKYTVAGDSYTIVLDGESFVSEGNAITLSFPDNSPMASSGGGEPSVRTFNLDGTVPEAGDPAVRGPEAGMPEGGFPEGGFPEGGAPEGEGTQDGSAPADGNNE